MKSKPIIIGLIISSIFGCRTRRVKLQPDISSYHLEKSTLLATESLPIKPKVHPINIDEASFRVMGVRANFLTYLGYETPVIAFEIPYLADYVEILRCPENASLFGGENDLNQVEIQAESLEEETRIFKSNNFWNAAINAQCILITTSLRDISFEDTTAPTGTFIYLLRSCVDPNRMVSSSESLGIHCSRQVTRSLSIQHVNQKKTEQLKKFALINQIRNQLDTVSRNIVDQTQSLYDNLYQCQRQHHQDLVTDEQNQALSTIIGLGTGAGLAATALGGLAVRSQLNHRNTKTTSKVATSISAVGIGSLIGTAAYIATLIYKASVPVKTPKDPPQCTSNEIETLKKQIDPDNTQQIPCFCSSAIAQAIMVNGLNNEFIKLIHLRDIQLNDIQQKGKENPKSSDDSQETNHTEGINETP